MSSKGVKLSSLKKIDSKTINDEKKVNKNEEK
ncbi:MAG: hypothetical protein K1060chlam5_01198 [Candidatus Anoxychlamydiales bacterium]|nr:hypothetical protein [Candidatus Anoxychlamydiales bacterium]